MIQVVVDYSYGNLDFFLEEIRFVVFSGDQKGIVMFEEKFEEFKKEKRFEVKF